MLQAAGARLDTRNDWSLSPLGVAVLKGQTGLVDWLVMQPGVDINARDARSGRSVLLSLAAAVPGPDTLAQLTNLVHKYGADPGLQDNAGKQVKMWQIKLQPFLAYN